jgi:hypothetical protein
MLLLLRRRRRRHETARAAPLLPAAATAQKKQAVQLRCCHLLLLLQDGATASDPTLRCSNTSIHAAHSMPPANPVAALLAAAGAVGAACTLRLSWRFSECLYCHTMRSCYAFWLPL